VIAGTLFGLEKALYSSIFQFSTTMILNSMHHDYRQKTILIVTHHSDKVYEMIRLQTNHTATLLTGKGLHHIQDIGVLYVVAHANEVSMLISATREIDADAFINVLPTEHVNGRFFTKPKD
jgi:uncharacterized membrane-anchored protein YitT (DUF2179 family)